MAHDPFRSISVRLSAMEIGNLVLAVHRALLAKECTGFTPAARRALENGLKHLEAAAQEVGVYDAVRQVIEDDPRFRESLSPSGMGDPRR